ncbi:hypothetical protein BGY98DRAFT_1180450 [Russula aff. rugulosa BPL654]|nr:hypothetical protein BGY98DRAFT_1180450 [Russula aff. rugulosa BPL654]
MEMWVCDGDGFRGAGRLHGREASVNSPVAFGASGIDEPIRVREKSCAGEESELSPVVAGGTRWRRVKTGLGSIIPGNESVRESGTHWWLEASSIALQARPRPFFPLVLSVHSRLRSDLIAANIGSKSTVDIAIYISLLRQGAIRVNNNKSSSTSSHGATITIGRDQHPAAYQVSAELTSRAYIYVAEPMHAKEIESEARATLCSVKNGMRVRLGEGSEGRPQSILRMDEERRVKAGFNDDNDEGSSPTVSTCDANLQRQVGALRSSIQRGLNLN